MEGDHRTAAQSFGAGRAHVILANDLQQAGAGHAGDVGPLPQTEHHGRSDDDLQVGPRVGPQRRSAQRHPIAKPEQRGEHDQHSQPEAGDRQKYDADESGDVIPQTVGTQRADDGHRDPDDPRKDHRDDADFRGQRAAPQNHLANAFGAEERPAEVSASDFPHPIQVLHHQRVAQPELRHVVSALRFAQLGKTLRAKNSDQRVSRQDPQHHEHYYGHADDRDRAEGQTTHDIAIHGRWDRRSWG